MTISRLTVDKLGVKLYDRVSAVIAEVVANSYDADATEVTITAPMGQLLATKQAGKLKDLGFEIVVQDNGCGMLVDDKVNEVNDFYLKVGAERRSDARRGDRSKKYGRKVMGRKGVGKLAPFGVCDRIEVITAGGAKVKGKDRNGQSAEGYLVAHILMDRAAILSDTDETYHPQPGPWDGTVEPIQGTRIVMKGFDHRQVPEMADFERQMAQRFGMASANWKIVLRDSCKKADDKGYTRTVGAFEAKRKPETEIKFLRLAGKDSESRDAADYEALGPNGAQLADPKPGFTFDGGFYPVTGWVGYAKEPYRDDLMAGIRIYCRGKIAAQTAVFNLKAGFTGEHDVRSYLIGELHADWLDETDDLIRTDRQDILWSHDLGVEFQAWGQSLVRAVGRITREPMRQSAWERFKEVSGIVARVDAEYPGEEHLAIREQTLVMAELMAKVARMDELRDVDAVEPFVQLSLLLGPHVTLDRKLKEAAENKDRPLDVISEILRTARIAELASFGRIAEERVRVIDGLESLKDKTGTLEAAFQRLLTEAPWLIDPTWSPITANRTFSTLKTEFAKYYKERTGKALNLEDFSDPNKQPDFVLSTQDQVIQIIEIKRPKHDLTDEEMGRIGNYNVIMQDFLADPGNTEFKAKFPTFHITLVCDGISLTGVYRSAFEGMQTDRKLTYMNWRTFLLRTHQMHDAFLKEAERQKKLSSARGS